MFGTEIVEDFFWVHQSTASSALGPHPFEVSAQKLHVQEHATKKRARLNPVEELIQVTKNLWDDVGKYAVVSEILGGVKIFKTSILQQGY